MKIDLDIILYISGAIASVAASVAIITRVVKKSISKVSEEVSEKVFTVHEEKIIKAIADLSVELTEFIQESRDNDDKQKNAAIATARARINESYHHYMKKGTIDPYTLSVLEDVYASYTAMGGNHLAARQIEDLRKLETNSNYPSMKEVSK